MREALPTPNDINLSFDRAVSTAARDYGDWFHLESDIRIWILHCFASEFHQITGHQPSPRHLDVLTDSPKYDRMDIVVAAKRLEDSPPTPVITCEIKYFWDQWDTVAFERDLGKLRGRENAPTATPWFVCFVQKGVCYPADIAEKLLADQMNLRLFTWIEADKKFALECQATAPLTL